MDLRVSKKEYDGATEIEMCPDNEYAALSKGQLDEWQDKTVGTHFVSGSPNISSSSLQGTIWRTKDMLKKESR